MQFITDPEVYFCSKDLILLTKPARRILHKGVQLSYDSWNPRSKLSQDKLIGGSNTRGSIYRATAVYVASQNNRMCVYAYHMITAHA